MEYPVLSRKLRPSDGSFAMRVSMLTILHFHFQGVLLLGTHPPVHIFAWWCNVRPTFWFKSIVWRQRAFGVDCWLADCGVLPLMRSRRQTGSRGRDELPIKMQSCCFYHVVLILLTVIFVENICTVVWLRYRATIFVLHYLVGLIIWIKYKASVVQKFLVTFVYLYCLVSNWPISRLSWL